MGKYKNTSGGPVQVSFLDLRTVEADEVVELPDFQAAHNPESKPGDPDYLAIAWPENRWEPVTEPVTGAKASKKAAE